MQTGAGLLQFHFGPEAAPAAEKLGIKDLLELLGETDGRKFLQACEYLNTANDGVERTDAATATAAKRFLRFFRADPKKKEALFKKLVRFAARLYLFAFEGLETTAALNNRRREDWGYLQLAGRVPSLVERSRGRGSAGLVSDLRFQPPEAPARRAFCGRGSACCPSRAWPDRAIWLRAGNLRAPSARGCGRLRTRPCPQSARRQRNTF